MRSFVAILFFLNLVSCSFVEKTPEEPIRLITKKGEPTQISAMLPTYTPIWIEEWQGDGKISSRLGFKGWDMDHNGTIDMLEVLDVKGEVSKTLYDFDLDGKVDIAD